MALETDEGHRVLSLGEFTTLAKNLDPAAPAGTLGEWLFSGSLPKSQVLGALHGSRLTARTPLAHQIIDRALARLEA